MQAASSKPPTESAIPERFNPDSMAGGLMEAEHRARYWWASAMVSGKDVLDAGCGEGYGLAMLALAGPSRLVGVDVAEDALERARSRVAGVAEVVNADIRDLPFDDHSVDVVVCFEVIEHVDRQDEALAELRRVLRPDGALLISSPNRDVYTPGNPHHVHEYVPAELREALEAHFEIVALYQQHPWLASVIGTPDAIESEKENGAIAFGRIGSPLAPGQETYVVGVASNSPLPDPSVAIVLADAFEVAWWEDRLADISRERDALAKAQAQASASAAQARKELMQLSTRILELEQETAAAAESELRAVTAREQAHEEARLRGQIINDITGSLSWRITSPLRAMKRAARGGR